MVKANEMSRENGIRDRIMDFIIKGLAMAKEKNRFNPMFRKCAKLQDEGLFFLAIQRVFRKCNSGLTFLQNINFDSSIQCARTSYFDALHSKRRSHVINSISQQTFRLFEEASLDHSTDYLQHFAELKEYSVLNGDGHYISHASHTAPVDENEKIYAAGSIYIQSLRTGIISFLSTVSDGTKKAHEMPIFRDIVSETPAESFGFAKTLWILDKAYMDNLWWWKQKKRNHFFITRTKTNFNPNMCGDLDFETTDPVNKGVTKYYQAGMSAGMIYNFVEYEDPETGKTFSFFTSLPSSFKPGLIAWLYFKRWNIEKGFDNFKNNLMEQKAWATGKTSLSIQSNAIAFVYNLCRIFHEFIVVENKSDNNNSLTISEKKYNGQIRKRKEVANKYNKEVLPLHYMAPRFTRISSAFITSFCSCFLNNVSFSKLWEDLTRALFSRL